MTAPTLIITEEGVIAWKIAAVPYGSEGARPRHPQQCPYYQEHGDETSCVSRSAGSICSGFMGGPPGYVYCNWGLP